MSNWMVVSYFADENYSKESLTLIRSLEKFSIPYVITKLPDLGGWLKNVKQKPEYIRRVLDERTENIVYLDVDCEVKAYPTLFDEFDNTDVDVALFTKNIDHHNAGVMYFKNSKPALDFLDGWIEITKKFPDNHDQFSLGLLIEQKSLKFTKLPVSYNTKFDGSQGDLGEAVILHNMASRRYGIIRA